MPLKLASLAGRLPAGLRVALTPAVAAARHHSMPVYRLEGETKTGRMAVLTSGTDPSSEFLAGRLFSGDPRRTSLGNVPIWRLDSYMRNAGNHVDFTFIGVDQLSARLWFSSDYLCVPDLVEAILIVPDNLDALWRSNHSLQQDIRQVRRRGLEMSISHLESDFDAFYRTMYVPFVLGRHGDMARPRDEKWMRERFLSGEILWIVEGGDKLAAAVVEIVDGVLHFWALATRGGDFALMKQGALSALYYYAIQHARNAGCTTIDFGGCKAFLLDGVLRYKRKWGMEIRQKSDNQNVCLIRWPRWNQAVETFFANTSVVHQDSSLLTVLTSPATSERATQSEADHLYHSISMPGIAKYLFVNQAGWEENVVPPASTVLADCGLMPGQLLRL